MLKGDPRVAFFAGPFDGLGLSKFTAAVLLCCCAAVLLCCCAAVLLCCFVFVVMASRVGSLDNPVGNAGALAVTPKGRSVVQVDILAAVAQSPTQRG